jgi:hypothetical protein
MSPAPPRRIRARCPRDRGRLLLEQDSHGVYLTCLSCGYVLEERSSQQNSTPQSTSWRAQPAESGRRVAAMLQTTRSTGTDGVAPADAGEASVPAAEVRSYR